MNRKIIDYRRRKQQGFVIKFKPLSDTELEKFKNDFYAATSGMNSRMIIPMGNSDPEFSVHWGSPKSAARKRLRIAHNK